MDNKVNRLAAEVHDVWAELMEHIFTNCGKHNNAGSFTISKLSVSKWTAQMSTPYQRLSRHEQLSNQQIAARYLHALDSMRNPYMWDGGVSVRTITSRDRAHRLDPAITMEEFLKDDESEEVKAPVDLI